MIVRPLSAADCATSAPGSAYPAASPSSNPCVVKLAGRRKMYNPYRGLTPKKSAAQKQRELLVRAEQQRLVALQQEQQRLYMHQQHHQLVDEDGGYGGAEEPYAYLLEPQQSVAGAYAVRPAQQGLPPLAPMPIPIAIHIPVATPTAFYTEAAAPPSVSSATSSKDSSADALLQEVRDACGALPPFAPAVRFVVVQFKHELCTFQGHFFVKEGDYVVVEADRGEHVGCVFRVLDEAPSFHVPSRIMRRASPTEVALIHDARPREAMATERIQRMADQLGLPLRIVDSELYTDGNKMTVFFAAKCTIDFRQLQRNLFREFHRRIWLINFSEVQYRNRNFRNRK